MYKLYSAYRIRNNMNMEYYWSGNWQRI